MPYSGFRCGRQSTARCKRLGSPQPARFSAVCAGVAGFSAPQRVEAFDALLRAEVEAERYRIEPDYLAAYWGATHGAPGVVVIAGTGAVTYARNEEGQERKEDGLGFLLGTVEAGSTSGGACCGIRWNRCRPGRGTCLRMPF